MNCRQARLRFRAFRSFAHGEVPIDFQCFRFSSITLTACTPLSGSPVVSVQVAQHSLKPLSLPVDFQQCLAAIFLPEEPLRRCGKPKKISVDCVSEEGERRRLFLVLCTASGRRAAEAGMSCRNSLWVFKPLQSMLLHRFQEACQRFHAEAWGG